MPDELDERIQGALRDEVAALPFAITPAMVERGLERRTIPLRFAVAGGLAAAAVLVVAAILAGGRLGPTNVGPPGPAAGTPGTSESPTAQPSETMPLNSGPNLNWEEVPLPADDETTVAYAGGQFLLFAGDSGGDSRQLSTSTDGRQWAPLADESSSWLPWISGVSASTDGTVLVWNGASVHLVYPNDPWTSDHQFPSCCIASAAIGRRGIVVVTWTETGVDAGFNRLWFSPDGMAWSTAPNPPRQPRDAPGRPPGEARGIAVAATDDGFFARTVDGTVWRSEDGLEWNVIGESSSPACDDGGWAYVSACAADLTPWGDGVMVLNGVRPPRYEYWTADGLQQAATGPMLQATDAGPMGIVTVDREANRVAFSPDGEVWGVSELPAGHRWSSELDCGGWTRVAVGHDSALVVLWELAPDCVRVAPSLWRGTLPDG